MNLKYTGGKIPGLILLSLLIAVSVIMFSNDRHKVSAEDNGNQDRGRTIPVVVSEIKRRTFEERLSLQGSVESKYSAMVPARISGIIVSLFVDEGDKVIAGITKLFQIDDIKLKQAVDISLQDLAVAQFSLKEKEANLEKVEADFEKAERDYQRFSRLLEKKAVSPDNFEQQESRYKQLKALLKHAHTLVDLDREKEKKAAVALEMAKKDLNDALIYAPITGTISKRYHELGEMGDKGKAVFRIDDLSVVEVSAFVPVQYYNSMIIGKTAMRISVNNINIGEYPLSYKSPTIDPKLRTFEIRCIVKGPPEGMAPGCIADIQIALDKRIALGIPRAAIQTRKGQSVLFTVENGQAFMQKAETGIEADGWVELKDNLFQEGTPVVTMGQFLLNDGQAVIIQKEAL